MAATRFDMTTISTLRFASDVLRGIEALELSNSDVGVPALSDAWCDSTRAHDGDAGSWFRSETAV